MTGSQHYAGAEQRARSEPAVKILTQLPGVGPPTAMVLLAEIGDVSPEARRGRPGG